MRHIRDACATLVTIAAVLACAPSAHAAWIHDPAGNSVQPYGGWSATSYAPSPNADVTVHVDDPNAPCGVRTACSLPGNIWVTSGDLYAKFNFYHELGHVFDYTMMTSSTRFTFGKILGDTRPWRSPPNSPHEKFAEGYAWCSIHALGKTFSGSLYTGLNYSPQKKYHPKVCALITRVADGASPV